MGLRLLTRPGTAALFASASGSWPTVFLAAMPEPSCNQGQGPPLAVIAGPDPDVHTARIPRAGHTKEEEQTIIHVNDSRPADA
jgi:hypothetical protein